MNDFTIICCSSFIIAAQVLKFLHSVIHFCCSMIFFRFYFHIDLFPGFDIFADSSYTCILAHINGSTILILLLLHLILENSIHLLVPRLVAPRRGTENSLQRQSMEHDDNRLVILGIPKEMKIREMLNAELNLGAVIRLKRILNGSRIIQILQIQIQIMQILRWNSFPSQT